jgi:peptide deformylase
LIIKNNRNKLNTICEPVNDIFEGEEIANKLFKELIDSKIGGIGLAANQIGINKRVCIINVKEPIAFINPKITKLDGEVIVPESCLSFPKKVITTKRAKWVTVESDNHGVVVLGSDTNDENLLEAVCAQHEIDHLDGITMFDRQVKREPLRSNKIGRNQKVTIEKNGSTMILKFKKTDKYLEDGWTLVEQ